MGLSVVCYLLQDSDIVSLKGHVDLSSWQYCIRHPRFLTSFWVVYVIYTLQVTPWSISAQELPKMGRLNQNQYETQALSMNLVLWAASLAGSFCLSPEMFCKGSLTTPPCFSTICVISLKYMYSKVKRSVCDRDSEIVVKPRMSENMMVTFRVRTWIRVAFSSPWRIALTTVSGTKREKVSMLRAKFTKPIWSSETLAA